MLIAAILGAYYIGPLPFAKNPNINMFTAQYQNKEIVNDFLSSIPQKFSIASTNNLGSHLSRRQKIYTIPVGIDKADIVAFLLNDSSAQPSLKAQIEIARKMKNDKNYIKIFEEGDFIVFKKVSAIIPSEVPKLKRQ